MYWTHELPAKRFLVRIWYCPARILNSFALCRNPEILKRTNQIHHQLLLLFPGFFCDRSHRSLKTHQVRSYDVWRAAFAYQAFDQWHSHRHRNSEVGISPLFHDRKKVMMNKL